MLQKFSIRKKLIIGVLCSCIIPYVVGGLYIKNTTEDWLYSNYIDHSSMMLEVTAKQVDESILDLMANLSEMMSNDGRVLAAKDGIRIYTDYQSGDSPPQKNTVEAELEAYLKTIRDSQKLVTMVSFGNEAGGYVEVPEFKPTKPYDPRVRPWYQNALTTNGTYFTEPYMTSVTQELVFAVSHAVQWNNQTTGVVSLTIKLDTLLDQLNQQNYGHDGYINILSPNNRFINSPKHNEWLLTSIDDHPSTLFKNIDQYHGNYFEGFIEDEANILSVYISPYSGWKYISVVKKADVLKESTVLTGIFVSVYAITLLIIALLIYLIATYMTKPILNIAQVIHEMAAFRFDQYRSKSFDDYSHLNDEIGEITRALNRMQENFMELDTTLTTMDEEIKALDIQEHSDFQLRLSKENPFAPMMSSVNVLLMKAYRYIDQIKHINEEMTQKNELLVASEEELTAQLEEIEYQKDMIKFLAEHDPLTDLPNRRVFHDQLDTILKKEKTGAVIMLDLDNFKGINDTLGHIYGDKVLHYVARKLKETATPHTFVSRFGGDEFLILVEHTTTSPDSIAYIKTLQDAFNQRVLIDNHEVIIEFSIGITRFPEDSSDIDQLVMNADLALYHIKNSGKNNYAFFDQSMAEHIHEKRIIKDELRDAIENEGFKLVYQPLVNLTNGQVTGYEALLRLKNNHFYPGEFIPVAEEDNMILTIGRLVTEMAIKQMKTWQNKGYEPRSISINFSAVQIHDYTYKDFLLELLERYNIPPKLITIEITENIFLENRESTIALLNELRSHGVRIAIDDFGTGYSSLSYLTELPIDVIKLDRTLGTKFLELENIAVMDSLIALAHSLNLIVVAEGIESYEQVNRLRIGKCDIIQGYYFSRPLEVEDVESNYNNIYTLKS